MSNRTIIYIDGENFLHRVAEILKDLKVISKKEDITYLNVVQLFQQLFPEYKNPQIRYYGTRVRVRGVTDEDILKHAQVIVESQRKLKRSLTNQGVIFIAAGSLRVREAHCQKCKKTTLVFKEKGVDVRLAVDLIEDARQGTNQIIVSSDSDLLPALKIARYSKKSKIIYVHHTELPNYAMIKASHESRVFTPLQIKQIYKKRHG
jgi:uncharacterized LabA/DUF88 family protein